jgi:hypothetical protein
MLNETKSPANNGKGNKLSSTNVQHIAYKKSDAVKYLDELSYKLTRLKYPNIPIHAFVYKRYRDDSANGLTKCIIDFLNYKGWQAERVANMGRQLTTRDTYTDVIGKQRTICSSKWIKGTGTDGTADISAIIAGKSVKIEVKYGKDRQSEKQKVYQDKVIKAGGMYYIARDFANFYEWYNLNFGENGRP